MTPQEANRKIRAAIRRRPDLRWSNPEYAKRFSGCFDNHYRGFCYIATQAFCQLVEEAVPYSNRRDHFWAVVDGKIWDPTKDQFDEKYPYERGKRTRFRRVTKRAQALLAEITE